MEAKFYTKDVEETFGLKGEKRLVKDVLFFSLKRDPVNGANVNATDFDNKATKEHIEQYPAQYQKFLSEKVVKVQEPVVSEEVKETAKEEEPVVE